MALENYRRESGVARKLLGSDGEHSSRFHTRRGKLLLKECVKSGPRAAIGRILGSRPAVPWMAPAAIDHLDNLLVGTMKVVELGSGMSTSWYAARTESVTSIEPDSAWSRTVREMTNDVDNVQLVHGAIAENLRSILLNLSPDVVIIDHNDEPNMTRLDAMELVRELSNPSIIVLDDSDREEYRRAPEMAPGWTEIRCLGYRSTPLRATETTLFLAPSIN